MRLSTKQLKQDGIKVTKAIFHSAVNNSDGIPSNYFSAESTVKSRNVDMWYSTEGLLCEHNKKFFIVPLSNIIFVNLEE